MLSSGFHCEHFEKIFSRKWIVGQSFHKISMQTCIYVIYIFPWSVKTLMHHYCSIAETEGR